MNDLQSRINEYRRLNLLIDETKSKLSEYKQLYRELEIEVCGKCSECDTDWSNEVAEGGTFRNDSDDFVYWQITRSKRLVRYASRSMTDQDWLHRLPETFVRGKLELDKARITQDFKHGAITMADLALAQLRFEDYLSLHVS